MKNIIFLLFSFSSFLFSSASIEVLKLKDDGEEISHLILKSTQYFKCDIVSEYNLNDKIKCDIENVDNTLVDKSFDFFDLKVDINQVVITPKYSYKIYKDDISIYNKKLFKDLKRYRRVDIIFFKKLPKYLKVKKIDDNLDFNIDFPKNEDYFIDVLSDDLTPVVSLKDVLKVDFIKRLFKKGDYVAVIKKADIELKKNNIYSSEILLYKLRALDKLLENKDEREFSYSDMEDASNLFIERFPSNKNITEVLYYKVKSIYGKGKFKSATIVANGLEKNFPGDFFSEKASILKAKYFYKKKNFKNKSYKIFKNILYNTKYPENALESAYNLVGNYLQDQKHKNAKVFLEKILDYDKEFLLKNSLKSYQYAKKFARFGDFVDAVKIMKVLSKSENSEEVLKDLALWEDKAGLKEDAYQDYKKYLELFPDGRYKAFVKEKMDNVLLDLNETNSSKKLNDIEKIMKNYKNDPIYKKALLEKVKLLYHDKKYENILKLSNQLKEINATSYIDKSVKKLVNQYLEEDECFKAANLVDRYKVTITQKKLYNLTKCYYKLARYKDSLELVKRVLKNNTDSDVVKWYKLGIRAASKSKDWTVAIKLYEDLVKIEDASIDKDIYFDMFYSYMGLKYYDKALDIVSLIENRYPNDVKLLDVYYDLVKYYKKKKIDLSLVLYGKKLLRLQKVLKVQTYSPLVDILVIKSLKNLNRYKEALSFFADAYLSKNINDVQKAQLLYLAGELSLKLKNIKQAKEFFIKCGNDVKSKTWQKLCSESLKLIDE